MRDNWIMFVLVLALFALSAVGSLASSRQSSVVDKSSGDLCAVSANHPVTWTQELYYWTLRHAGYSVFGVDSMDSTAVQVVPEASTILGFGAAIVLNGLGAAGTSYYLRRKYNCVNAKRYAARHVDRLPMFVDTVVSMLFLVAVSPVLLAVATASALKSGTPKVYGKIEHL